VAQPPDLCGVDRRRSSLADATRLGGGEHFELPFVAKLGHELGKDAEHVEERIAGRGTGVNRSRLAAFGLQLGVAMISLAASGAFMVTVDLTSFLWGSAGTVTIFIAGWATKHALDRLLLPRVLDWWATRTRSLALMRAQTIVDNFESDLLTYSDIRLLLYTSDRGYRRSLFWSIVLIFEMIAMTAGALRVLLDKEISSKVRSKIDHYLPFFTIDHPSFITIFMLADVLFVVFVLYLLLGRPSLNLEMMCSPETVASRTLARTVRLLGAAGLSETESLNWCSENAHSLLEITHKQSDGDCTRNPTATPPASS
jgi:hypothetical protein